MNKFFKISLIVIFIFNIVLGGGIIYVGSNIDSVMNSIGYVNKSISLLLDKVDSSILDTENILKANVVMHNNTKGYKGSGTIIKVNGKFFILSCAHLIKEEDDLFTATINNGYVYDLELVKIDKINDLALYSIYAPVQDFPYLEVASKSPKAGSEILIVGNPADMEDVITEGIIAKVNRTQYMFTNKIWFGNSGGCVLYKGKVIGVAVSIRSLLHYPIFMSYGFSSNVRVLKSFLRGV